ncbi:MAG: hypothetical protein V9G19_13030 [Tetrasphaera sp.]
MTEPESIEAYAERVYAAQAAAGGHLPLAADGFTSWAVFPFEGELRAKPLEPLVEDEAPRAGEDPDTCWCTDSGRTTPDWPVVWHNETWHIKTAPPSGSPLILVLEPNAHHDLADLPPDLAAEYGVLSVLLVRAIEALPSVGRCHTARWGDGGAHAHAWFLARPARLPQLRGTFMAAWDDILPPMPAAARDDNADFVIDRLIADHGGERAGG